MGLANVATRVLRAGNTYDHRTFWELENSRGVAEKFL